MTTKLHWFEIYRSLSEGQLFCGCNLIFLIILTRYSQSQSKDSSFTSWGLRISNMILRSLFRLCLYVVIVQTSQGRMSIGVLFSFAELQDMKMKKKNETGPDESWKNKDFPICKTIVRLRRYKGSMHRSFLRSIICSFGRWVVRSSAWPDCSRKFLSIFQRLEQPFAALTTSDNSCLLEQLLRKKHSMVNWFRQRDTK